MQENEKLGLIEPISLESPCGVDLRYDPEAEFDVLESMLTPAAGADPNWEEIRERALATLARGKDLRVMIILATASLKTEGLGGFNDCLEVMGEWLERYWENLHPILDEAEKAGKIEPRRCGILENLALIPGEPYQIVYRLRELPLIGKISMDMVSLALGDRAYEVAVPEEQRMRLDEIKAVIQTTPLSIVEQILNQCNRGLHLLGRIRQQLEKHRVQERFLPRFTPLESVLQEVVAFFSPFITATTSDIDQIVKLTKNMEKVLPEIEQYHTRLGQVLEAVEALIPAPPGSGLEQSNLLLRSQNVYKRLKDTAHTAGKLPPELVKTALGRLEEFQRVSRSMETVSISITKVQSRHDAEHLLEAVGDYYRQQEPSSPLPMLLSRARRWSRMSFRDILLDLELGEAAMGRVDSVLRPEKSRAENPENQP